MSNQAMNEDDSFILGEDDSILLINQTREAITKLQIEFDFSKRVKDLFLNEDFQYVIIETVLGSSAQDEASKLLNPTITVEDEQSTLNKLKSLRLLKHILNDMKHDAEVVEYDLDLNKKYLTELLDKKGNTYG